VSHTSGPFAHRGHYRMANAPTARATSPIITKTGVARTTERRRVSGGVSGGVNGFHGLNGSPGSPHFVRRTKETPIRTDAAKITKDRTGDMVITISLLFANAELIMRVAASQARYQVAAKRFTLWPSLVQNETIRGCARWSYVLTGVLVVYLLLAASLPLFASCPCSSSHPC
jgi:hypothetical protein